MREARASLPQNERTGLLRAGELGQIHELPAIRSRQDRRAVMIELSAQGKELVSAAPGVIQGDLIRGLETLPEEELLDIDASMARLVAILGVQQLNPLMIHGSDEAVQGDDTPVGC